MVPYAFYARLGDPRHQLVGEEQASLERKPALASEHVPSANDVLSQNQAIMGIDHLIPKGLLPKATGNRIRHPPCEVGLFGDDAIERLRHVEKKVSQGNRRSRFSHHL